MDSPKDLPPWPEDIKRQGGYHVYKGALYTVFDDGNSANTAQLEDMVTALRARLALAVKALQEARQYVYDYGSERSMAPVVERIDKTITACREPS